MLTRPGSRRGPEWMSKLGHATLGALAIGRYAHGPGIAFGYHEASGKQKESLFG